MVNRIDTSTPSSYSQTCSTTPSRGNYFGTGYAAYFKSIYEASPDGFDDENEKQQSLPGKKGKGFCFKSKVVAEECQESKAQKVVILQSSQVVSPTESQDEREQTNTPESCKAVVAATIVLKSGTFDKSFDDVRKPSYKGYTIGEAQGSPGLRRAARKHSNPCVEAFSPSVLRHAKSVIEALSPVSITEENKFIYLRNFRILQLKRLGHALSLSRKIQLKDGTTTHYNGFSEAFSIPMVASSVKEYSLQHDSLITEEDGVWISDALINSSSHDCYFQGEEEGLLNKIRNPQHMEPVSISSGYEWHGIHLFFFRGFLIYCNRGWGCGVKAGVSVYKIPNNKLVTKEIITNLIRRHELDKKEWNREFNIDPLIHTLELVKMYILEQKEQKTGNCTYTSTKSGVRALLAIKYIIDSYGDRKVPLSLPVWKEAFTKTKEKYKEWSKFDKNLVIKDLFNDAGLMEDEKSSVISKEQFLKTFSEVEVIVSADPNKYSEVVPLFNRLLKSK